MEVIEDEFLCVCLYIGHVCQGERCKVCVIFSGERLVLRDLQVFQLQRVTDIYQKTHAILCMETGCD